MKTYIPLFFSTFLVFSSCTEKIPSELPNILWITSEDNSPMLGCYGDSFATTPNLDKLASQGILFTHAYANAPVCAPTRNTILTGVYASSGGNEHMRSKYRKSEEIRFYPEFLRAKGYYCTNNAKTDYNIDPDQLNEIWDESSTEAHYYNRKEGQPFFAVFNSTLSHESSIHKWKPVEQLRHKPEDIILPPYHPDTPEMRHDWAQYYDNVEDMDSWVGKILKELEESGEEDNTIVFYYSDHGGVLGRSKRFLYESGTHIPFLVRVPEKYKYLLDGKKPGSREDRLVSFVDLAPTLLSIIGTPVPEFMQGHAFLGKQKTKDPDYAFMFRGRMDERYDMSRSARNDKFRYTINYMPYRQYGQFLSYLWRAPSMQSWERAYREGKCNEVQSAFFRPKPVEELYLTESDPWEIHNLAADPDYKDVLIEMRQAVKDWVREIKDAGFIPEPIRYEIYGNEAMYDIVRQKDFPLEKIIDAADMSTNLSKENIPALSALIKDENPAIRYWGVTGLLNKGENAAPAKDILLQAINDTCGTVAVVAAECLYNLGEKEKAVRTFLRVLDKENQYLRVFALNSIDFLEAEDQILVDKVIELSGKEEASNNEYSSRMINNLLNKWETGKALN